MALESFILLGKTGLLNDPTIHLEARWCLFCTFPSNRSALITIDIFQSELKVRDEGLSLKLSIFSHGFKDSID